MKNKIIPCIICLTLLSFTYTTLLSTTNALTTNETLNMISTIPTSNIAISTTTGQWNERIHEPGNILYDSADTNKQYKVWYSAFKGSTPYETSTVNSLGYAYSQDQQSWTQVKCTITNPPYVNYHVEDPYVVKVGSEYWMYTEDATYDDNGDISLMKSSDGVNWQYITLVLTTSSNSFDKNAVGSPIVWIENTQYFMLYEGIGLDYKSQICKAESTDGVNWLNRQVTFSGGASGSWDNFAVVPDDIYISEGVYYLLYHGGKTDGSQLGWYEGLAYTNNFNTWTRYSGNPLLPAEQLTGMFAFYNGNYNIYACNRLYSQNRGIDIYKFTMQSNTNPTTTPTSTPTPTPTTAPTNTPTPLPAPTQTPATGTFKVGDTVQNIYSPSNIGTIKSINLNKNWAEVQWNIGKNYGISLSHIRLVSSPTPTVTPAPTPQPTIVGPTLTYKDSTFHIGDRVQNIYSPSNIGTIASFIAARNWLEVSWNVGFSYGISAAHVKLLP